MSTGIKECELILDALEKVAYAYSAAKKDGHVNWLDMPKFFGVVGDLRKALDGSDQIALEIADLDPKETEELLNRLFQVAIDIGSLVIKK